MCDDVCEKRLTKFHISILSIYDLSTLGFHYPISTISIKDKRNGMNCTNCIIDCTSNITSQREIEYLRESCDRNQHFPPLKRLDTEAPASLANGGSGSRLLVEDQVTLSLTLGCHFKPSSDPMVSSKAT